MRLLYKCDLTFDGNLIEIRFNITKRKVIQIQMITQQNCFKTTNWH